MTGCPVPYPIELQVILLLVSAEREFKHASDTCYRVPMPAGSSK